uniref:Protein kinase domain-containing protein n=1 Tax=Heterorhabditis bacteriophora TaxID=37862 RepID=A0A1I7WEK1_HETBA
MRMVFDLLSSSVVRVESSMWQGVSSGRFSEVYSLRSNSRNAMSLHSFKNIYVARRNPRRRRDAAEIVEEFVVAKQVQWMEVLAPLFREKRQLYSVPTSLTASCSSLIPK